jgi:hypothetical protein
VPAPSLSPAKTIGSVEGTITFRITLQRPAPKATAARTRTGSTCRAPTYVFSARGKNTPRAITATFDGSPIPSQRIRSGSSAILGMGKVAAMRGVPTASATENTPTTIPTAIPAAPPRTKPRISRLRLAARCTASSPDTSMSRASRSTPSGDGRKRAGTQPARHKSSQSTTTPTSAATRSAR